MCLLWLSFVVSVTNSSALNECVNVVVTSLKQPIYPGSPRLKPDPPIKRCLLGYKNTVSEISTQHHRHLLTNYCHTSSSRRFRRMFRDRVRLNAWQSGQWIGLGSACRCRSCSLRAVVTADEHLQTLVDVFRAAERPQSRNRRSQRYRRRRRHRNAGFNERLLVCNIITYTVGTCNGFLTGKSGNFCCLLWQMARVL